MCVWAGAVLKGNLQFGWQMPEKSTGACVRLIGPKFKSWEMGGVLSGNWNCCDRKVHVERGQWRGLPHLRLCRLNMLKERWEEPLWIQVLHWMWSCVQLCLSSEPWALFTNGSFQRLLEHLLPIQGYLKVKFVLVCGPVPGSGKGGLDCVNFWPLVYCSKHPK